MWDNYTGSPQHNTGQMVNGQIASYFKAVALNGYCFSVEPHSILILGQLSTDRIMRSRTTFCSSVLPSHTAKHRPCSQYKYVEWNKDKQFLTRVMLSTRGRLAVCGDPQVKVRVELNTLQWIGQTITQPQMSITLRLWNPTLPSGSSGKNFQLQTCSLALSKSWSLSKCSFPYLQTGVLILPDGVLVKPWTYKWNTGLICVKQYHSDRCTGNVIHCVNCEHSHP